MSGVSPKDWRSSDGSRMESFRKSEDIGGCMNIVVEVITQDLN